MFFCCCCCFFYPNMNQISLMLTETDKLLILTVSRAITPTTISILRKIVRILKPHGHYNLSEILIKFQ